MLRFDPFSDFETLTRTLLNGSSSGTTRAPRFMPMDLYRLEDRYILTADLPGVDPGSIDVSVDNGVLALSADRSLPTKDGVEWLANERFVGSFRRQVTLGENIDSRKISAQYNNGVLTVTVPLAEAAKPRKIQVEQVQEPQQITAHTAQ